MALKKSDICKWILERLLRFVDKDDSEWVKPWDFSLPMPMNADSGKNYSGSNIFPLMIAAAFHGDHRFLTLKQINKRGGRIIKGESPYYAVFYKSYEKEDAATGKPDKRFAMRFYKVWNVAQCTGLPFEPPVEIKPMEPIAAVEKIISRLKGEGLKLQSGSSRACFIPKLDVVQMPPLGTFADSEAHAKTLFHELIHWTGHESRLNREGIASPKFGTEPYAFEELVAELGACFICGQLGISSEEDCDKNSGAYLRTWIEKAKLDPTILIDASRLASKAMTFVLGEESDEVIEVSAAEEKIAA